MRGVLKTFGIALGCLLGLATFGFLIAADLPISGLPVATTPLGGTELGVIVQGGVTKQVTMTPANLAALAVSANLGDIPNATTARTNLKLGTAAVASTGTSGALVPFLNTANSWSAGQRGVPVIQALSGATINPDFNTGNYYSVTLVHASCPCTLVNPLNIVAGQAGQFAVIQSASGSDLISTYGSLYKFSGGTKPTLTATASSIDILSYYVIDATHIAVSALTNFQ